METTSDLTEDKKAEIDSMDYYSLLRKWRFTPGGSSDMFQGDTGKYYAEVMTKKRNELAPGEAARISKEVGWE